MTPWYHAFNVLRVVVVEEMGGNGKERERVSSSRRLEFLTLFGWILLTGHGRRGLTCGYLIKALHGFGQIGHHLFVFVKGIPMTNDSKFILIHKV
jgi:hypothetical protein